MISIIIPVLNEEKTIEKLLIDLNNLEGDKEIILVDGGSSDNTISIASKYAKVLSSKKGRSSQMNLGGDFASGEILWFVHSDSVVHRDSLKEINNAVESGAIAGGFSLYFHDYQSWFMKFIAKTSNLRARLFKLYFGDQGIFVRRDVFNNLHGYPLLPIMEDFEFSLRVKSHGKMKMIPLTIGTSGRRFKSGGAFKTLMLMHKMKLYYILGVAPERLSEMYREAR